MSSPHFEPWRRLQESLTEGMNEHTGSLLALGWNMDGGSHQGWGGWEQQLPTSNGTTAGLDVKSSSISVSPRCRSRDRKLKLLAQPPWMWELQHHEEDVRLGTSRRKSRMEAPLCFRHNVASWSVPRLAETSHSRRQGRFGSTATTSARLVSTETTEVGGTESKTWEGLGWLNSAARASIESRVLMKNISTWERASIGAAAGGVAGAFTYACLHPLDTIKTRLQAKGAAEIYKGPLDVAVKILQSKGILGFYCGISAVIFGSMLSSAVYFGTCEFGKALLAGQQSACPPLLIPPISAAMGNIVSSAILVPKEVITQRMQAGAVGRSWEVLLRTVQKEGVKGLYAGYSAALTRNLPASVLSFTSFEYLKAGWITKTGKSNLEPWESVTSGALAGVISAALTTPLDVVKTRLMTQAKRSVLLGTEVSKAHSLAEAELTAKIAASTYKGISSTLKQIWVEEGWAGLTRGVGPRLLYSACFSALGYCAFETARITFLKHHLARKESSEVDAFKVAAAPLS